MAATDQKLRYEITAGTSSAQREIDKLNAKINTVGGNLTGAFGGFLPVAGAIAGAVAGVGTALFTITKNAAEFGSTIFDASQKTGLGAVSISSLKVAADQSGASLETVTGGIAKFAKTVGAAGEDAKKSAKFVEDFGIQPQDALNDLDGALAKVFKRIYEAKPGVEQMTLAEKAFGKSGADLIPVIQATGGDLEAFKKHCEELGLTIDDKAAKSADEFGDQLDTLSGQLAGVGRTIGTAVMPEFTTMATAMSDWLVQNRSEVQTWAKDVTYWVRKLVVDVKKEMNDLGAIGDLFDNIFSGGTPDDLSNAWKKRETESIRLGIIQANNYENPGPWNPTEDDYADYKAGKLPFAKPLKTAADEDPKTGGKSASRAAKQAKLDLPPLGSMSTLVISSGNAQWDAWFTEMGHKFGVDPNVLLLQANKESSGNAGAVSPKGAKGFSQFMPGTAKRFGVDTSSVKDSIRGQAEYMKVLLSMFGGDYKKALAGYNAGESAVQRYGGVPPFAETRDYVSKISGQYASRVRKGKGGGFGTYDPGADVARRADAEFEAYKKGEDRKLEYGQSISESLLQIAQHEYEVSLEYNDPTAAIKASQEIHDIKMEQIAAELAALVDLAMEAPRGSDAAADALHRLTLKQVEFNRVQHKEGWEQQKRDMDVEQKEFDEVIAKFNKKIDLLKDQIKLQETLDEMAKDALEDAGAAVGAKYNKRHQYDPAKQLSDSIDQLLSKMNAVTGIQNVLQGMADLGIQAFEDMANAVGGAVAQWALYGDSISEALKKALAAELAHVAGVATVNALYATALGVMRLAEWDFVGAGHAFASAALWAALAGGSALGARALSKKDREQNQAAKSGTNAGAARGSNDAAATPYSRASADAYISGRRQDSAITQLSAEVRQLHQKLSSMPAHEVLTTAIRQKPGVIGNQAISDMKRNSGIGREAARTMGIR